jgi:uncharacterized protein YdaU (DUF1376 family)
MKGEFYKMDFRAWNVGTVDLTLEQEGAYLRLCHAMYDVGGPVPNSTRFLMSIFRCGNVKAAALVNHLISAGKIAVTSDGRLFNHRVSEELAARERVSAVRRAAGEKGGSAERVKVEFGSSEGRVTPEWMSSDPRVTQEWSPSEGRVTASNPLKNQDPHKANASDARNREEERRGEQKDLLSEGASDDAGKDQQLDLTGGEQPEEKAPRKRKRVAYPEAFETLWSAYPTDANMSKQEAHKAWEKLDDADRGLLMASIGPFKAWVAKQHDYRVVHLERFIKWRRFEGFAAKAAAKPLPAAGGAPECPDAYLASLSDDRWRDEVNRWRARLGYWPLRARTPPPDDPRTAVPKHILAELNIHPTHARAA